MNRIIVIGSINMDVVAQVSRFPAPGETLFGSALHFIPGGKGANQAVAASRLTDHVHLIGKLGRDAFGVALHEFLQQENLDHSGLIFSDTHPTGTALITVDQSSENAIVVISGSNMALTPDDIQLEFAPGDVVLSQFEIPQSTITAAFGRAKAAGATTLLNPAPAAPIDPELRPLVDYLIVNETELAFFAHAAPSTSVDQQVTQAQQIRATPAQTIVLTQGKAGVIAISAADVITVAGIPVSAIDTTGAGDCFVGALAVAIAEGQSLHASLAFANRAAAISVTRLGAATSMPHRHELDS